MNWTSIVTGGFLRGYRTYVLAAALVLNAVLIPWGLGDVNLLDALKDNWEQLAIALGLMSAANH